MKNITLGGLHVGRVGLGAMTMAPYYTGAGQFNDEAERTIHRAFDLDLGVGFVAHSPLGRSDLSGENDLSGIDHEKAGGRHARHLETWA